MKNNSSGCFAGIIVFIAIAIGVQGGIVGVFIALAIVAGISYITVSIIGKSKSINTRNEEIKNSVRVNELIEYDEKDNMQLSNIFEFEETKYSSFRISKYIGFDDEEIHIPKTYKGICISELKNGIFANCTALKKIVIEANIEVIPEKAFDGCEKLESVSLPPCITKIGAFAFYSCTSLSEFDFLTSINAIESCAFSHSGITKIKIPDKVQSISMSVFQSCDNLQEVEIPFSVRTIEKTAFESCDRLQKVILNEGLQEIQNEAFCNCHTLHDITIPKSVSKIGANAFNFSRICRPDRRYNPFIVYDQNSNIVIHCYPGSFAQEFFRGKAKCVNAESI